MNITPCPNSCMNGQIVIESLTEKDANGHPVINITTCPCNGRGLAPDYADSPHPN